MHPMPSSLVMSLFIALCAGLFISLVRNIFAADQSSRTGAQTAGVLFLWIVFLGVLAYGGYFNQDFTQFPPRIALIGAGNLAFLMTMIFSKKIGVWVQNLKMENLIWIQSFRFILEIILNQMAKEGTLPQNMTFRGHNFDILIGLSAPVIAYLYTQGKVSNQFLKIWNIAGIILVANVLIHGILSAPGVEVLHPEVLNYIISYFPYVWLPGFFVLTALMLHILSLRKLYLRT